MQYSKRLGGAFVVLIGVFASCAKSTPPIVLECKPGESDCNTFCADLQTDTENCGKCGTVCPGGQACVKGACSTECPTQNTLCVKDGGSGKCVNTKSDNQNCGACSKSCKAGEICFAGSCSGTCGDSKTGQTVCGADGGSPYCANLKVDNLNCGACGKTCITTEFCSDGACVSQCSGDQVLCGGEGGPLYCASVQTDNANCGDCGIKCGAMQACAAGVCTDQCAAGQTICSLDGGTSYCANTQSDNYDCGTCGNICPSSKPICVGGKCSDGSCNRNALVLGDGVSGSNTAYQTLLQNVGFTVTVISSGTTTYTGTPAASGFGVVIVTPGTTYSTDMPSGGQSSITSAQSGANTGVIFTEWAAYEVQNAHYSTLSSLLLFPRTTGNTSTLTFTLTSSGHPIWNGLASSFTTSVSLGTNSTATLSQGIQVASCSQCGGQGVAARDTTGGRIVQIAHAAAYSGTWYSDTNLTKMMANAGLWAARCN